MTDRGAQKNLRNSRVPVLAVAACILALTGASFSRNMTWVDEIALWSDVVKKSPAKAVGYNNLGYAYTKQFNNLPYEYIPADAIDLAIRNYDIALQLDPAYTEAHYNIGFAYRAKGSPGKAIEHFERALRLEPGPERAADLRSALRMAREAQGAAAADKQAMVLRAKTERREAVRSPDRYSESPWDARPSWQARSRRTMPRE